MNNINFLNQKDSQDKKIGQDCEPGLMKRSFIEILLYFLLSFIK
jgi:hypothetical protein